ncbi:MAG: leucine-rich repeat protein [Clostridia bacterium]|nr:leucine-rich repeat protein [Clostridia bacterium]
MPDFLTWILPYAISSLLLSGVAILLCSVWGKRLRSRTCLLLLLLLCIRIVLPTGLFPIALLRIPTGDAVISEEGALPSDGQPSVVPMTPVAPVIPDTDASELPLDTGAEEDNEASDTVPMLPSEESMENPMAVDVWTLANCIGLTVWIVGAIVCFAVFYIPSLLYRRRLLKSASSVTDGALLQIYKDVCSDAELRRIPTLYQSTAVHSPCLCGLLHPYIVLPCDGAFSSQELEMLLCHEIQHDRGGDLYIKHLVNLCLAVQWWNPLFYLLAQRVSYYIEVACDESVLCERDAEFRLQYGALLAKIAKKSMTELRMHYALEAGFARRVGHTALRRVQNLLENAPRRRGGATTVAVVLFCACSLFLYGFSAPEDASAVPNDAIGAETVMTVTEISEEPADSSDTAETARPEEPSKPSGTEIEPVEEEMLIFSYVSSYNWYEVTGVRDKTVSEVVIPDTYRGRPVVRIAEQAFADCRNLTRVIVTDNVKDIGDGAFLRCTSLRDIVLSSNLVSLGASAFRECFALEQVEIPGGVMTLQSDTFYHCTSLQTVTLGEGLERIQSRAFVGNTALTSLTLPSTVWMLDVSAIKDCEQLRTLYYGGTVRSWEQITRRTVQQEGTLLTW